MLAAPEGGFLDVLGCRSEQEFCKGLHAEPWRTIGFEELVSYPVATDCYP